MLNEAGAKHVLRVMFWHPFKVARNQIDGVMSEADSTEDDCALTEPVIMMSNNAISLDHLDRRPYLDEMHTFGRYHP